MRSRGKRIVICLAFCCALVGFSGSSFSQSEFASDQNAAGDLVADRWLTQLHEARSAYQSGDWQTANELFHSTEINLPRLLPDSQIQFRLLRADCLYRLGDTSMANDLAIETLRTFGIIDKQLPEQESNFQELTRQCICQSLRTLALTSSRLSIERRIAFALQATEYATNEEASLAALVDAVELFLQRPSDRIKRAHDDSKSDSHSQPERIDFLIRLQNAIESRAIKTELLVRTLLVIAKLQLANSEFEACQKTLDEIRQLPINAKLRSLLALMHGQIAYRQSDFKSASDWIAKVEPSDFSMQTKSKLLYLRWQIANAEDHSDSEQLLHLQQLADVSVNNAHVGFARSKIAARAAAEGDIESAEFYARSALDCPLPSSVRSHARFILASLAIRNLDWKNASAHLAEIDTDAQGLQLRRDIMRVEIDYRLGEWDGLASKIDALLNRATNIEGGPVTDSKPLLKLRLAELRAHERNWNEARRISEQLLAESPEFSQIYEVRFVAARACVNTIDFSSALQHLKSVIADPRAQSTEFADRARWLTGEVHFLSRKWERAIQAYSLIDQQTPNTHWLAASKLQSAKCYEYLGQPDQAAKLYTELSLHFPNSPHAKSADSRLTKLRTDARLQR